MTGPLYLESATHGEFIELHQEDGRLRVHIAELGLHAGVVVDGDFEVSGVFSQLTYTYPRRRHRRPCRSSASACAPI